MLKKYLLFVTISLISLNIFPQADSAKKKSFEFLPKEHLNSLLKANMRDAKFGTVLLLDNGDLKLDIGHAFDFLSFYTESNKRNIVVGFQFGTFARVTGYENARLQVAAVDGLFGGYVGFKQFFENNSALFGWLKFTHHSAHLVDGSWNYDTKNWMDNKYPEPFANDFFELTIGKEQPLFEIRTRYYGSVSFATLIRPQAQKKVFGFAGFEAYFDNLKLNFFDKYFVPYIAYQFDLKGNPEYTSSHQIQFGCELGNPLVKSFSIYGFYYSGNNFYGEYYTERLNKFGLGFFVEWH